jgi:hypothetical protein
VAQKLKPGSYLFYGRVQNKYGQVSIVNPTFEPIDRTKNLQGIVPVYSLSGGLTQKVVRGAVAEAMRLVERQSAIPFPIVKKYNFSPLPIALKKVHSPKTLEDISIGAERIALEEYFVLLPEDSYHMTLIRGLNHQVRKEGFWPPMLSKELPMTEVDDYIEAAMNRAVLPKKCHMKFRSVNKSSKSCIVIYLDPADEEENKKLRDFRDRAAEEIGFRLPKHEEYNFHISLAYTRVIPEGEAAERMDALREKINELLANEPAFDTAEPYVAFYDDMYAFHPHRIPRD